MTIDEAINVNENLQMSLYDCMSELERKANQLSIEALKREDSWRQLSPTQLHQLLPGETKD